MFNREVILGVQKLALKNQLPLSMCLAIAQAESNGVTGTNITFTDYKGKVVTGYLAIIRFEGHQFHKRLTALGPAGKAKLDRAVREKLANPKQGGVPNPKSQKDRYDLLARAMKIDPDIAVQSTSFGLGQTMGFNAVKLGYASPLAFYETMLKGGVVAQIEALVNYLVVFGLKKAVQNKDAVAVAKGYNGPDFAKYAYDVNIARYEKQWDDYLRKNPGVLIDTGAPVVVPPRTSKTVMTFGSSGPAVKKLQTDLVTLAFANFQKAEDTVWFTVLDKIEANDGKFGPATAYGVEAFQEYRKLNPIDGIAGEDTLAALADEMAKLERRPGEEVARIKADAINHFAVKTAQRKAYETALIEARKAKAVEPPKPEAKAIVPLPNPEVTPLPVEVPPKPEPVVIPVDTPTVSVTVTGYNPPDPKWDKLSAAVAAIFLAIAAVLSQIWDWTTGVFRWAFGWMLG